MEPFYFVSTFFLQLFFYVLKQVPISFSCLGEWCDAVLLWTSGNVLCTTKYHYYYYYDKYFILGWTAPLSWLWVHMHVYAQKVQVPQWRSPSSIVSNEVSFTLTAAIWLLYTHWTTSAVCYNTHTHTHTHTSLHCTHTSDLCGRHKVHPPTHTHNWMHTVAFNSPSVRWGPVRPPWLLGSWSATH